MPAYLSLTSGQKFLVGKHDAEDGVIAKVQLFQSLSSRFTKFVNFSPAIWYNSFGDSPIYYHQSFIIKVFVNILPYQYFALYGNVDYCLNLRF